MAKTHSKTIQPLALKRLQLVRLVNATGVTSLTNTTLGNWISKGCPTNSADGRLNVFVVLAWLAEDRRNKASEQRVPAAKEIDEARIAAGKAEKIEMENAIKKGEYVLKSEITEQLRSLGKLMCRKLERTARRHGPAVVRDVSAALEEVRREAGFSKAKAKVA